MWKSFVKSTHTKAGRLGPAVMRSGLAPMEMVLVLPLLMALMATLIVFGYATMWKLRTETVSRDQAWRIRFAQFANRNAQASEWPEEGETGVLLGNELAIFSNDSVLENPLIAGPLPNVGVNEELLDYERGALTGIAAIERQPPVFSRLSTFDFEVDHALLDDRFQYRQMQIRNVGRRIPQIYEIGLDEILESDQLRAAIAAAEANNQLRGTRENGHSPDP